MPTTIYRCPVTFPAIPSTGGVAYANAGSDLAVTAAGSAGQVLISNGAGAPTWVAPGGGIGTVTSVAMTVPTGLTVGGSPITAAGTLAVTLTAGYTIPGGGSAGQVLTSNGAAAPTFQTLPSITPAALTRVDDTNITLTLGGTPATALLQAASLTLGWTGTLAVSRGGIGTGTAGIGAFNNITGYTASGATGTTSTDLVFSTSPVLITPTLGVASGTRLTLTEPVGASALTLTGATQVTSFPLIAGTQTWNGAGVVFTALDVNVTNTSSSTNSRLIALRVASTDVFTVKRGGDVITTGGMNIGATMSSDLSGVSKAAVDNGTNIGTGFFTITTGVMSWSSTTSAGGTADLVIRRDAASVLAQRVGTAAQRHRLYNTFTTVLTAGEWWKQDWITTANQFRFGTCNGTSTGTARAASWDYGGLEASPTAAITVPITSGSIVFGGPIETPGYAQFTEMTAPAAGATNTLRLFAQDNGAGKTQLMVLFATGAAQQIAIEA